MSELTFDLYLCSRTPQEQSCSYTDWLEAALHWENILAVRHQGRGGPEGYCLQRTHTYTHISILIPWLNEGKQSGPSAFPHWRCVLVWVPPLLLAGSHHWPSPAWVWPGPLGCQTHREETFSLPGYWPSETQSLQCETQRQVTSEIKSTYYRVLGWETRFSLTPTPYTRILKWRIPNAECRIDEIRNLYLGNTASKNTLTYLQRLEDGPAVGSQLGVRGLAEELWEGGDGVQFVGWNLETNDTKKKKKNRVRRDVRWWFTSPSASTVFLSILTSENLPSPNHCSHLMPWVACRLPVARHVTTIPGHQENPLIFPHTSSPMPKPLLSWTWEVEKERDRKWGQGHVNNKGCPQQFDTFCLWPRKTSGLLLCPKWMWHDAHSYRIQLGHSVRLRPRSHSKLDVFQNESSLSFWQCEQPETTRGPIFYKSDSNHIWRWIKIGFWSDLYRSVSKRTAPLLK